MPRVRPLGKGRKPRNTGPGVGTWLMALGIGGAAYWLCKKHMLPGILSKNLGFNQPVPATIVPAYMRHPSYNPEKSGMPPTMYSASYRALPAPVTRTLPAGNTYRPGEVIGAPPIGRQATKFNEWGTITTQNQMTGDDIFSSLR